MTSKEWEHARDIFAEHIVPSKAETMDLSTGPTGDTCKIFRDRSNMIELHVIDLFKRQNFNYTVFKTTFQKFRKTTFQVLLTTHDSRLNSNHQRQRHPAIRRLSSPPGTHGRIDASLDFFVKSTGIPDQWLWKNNQRDELKGTLVVKITAHICSINHTLGWVYLVNEWWT